MKKAYRVMVLMLVATGLVLWGIVGTTQAEPIRVLVLLGGEYHPYEAGSKIMLEAASQRLDIKADFVRIDNPPKGFPPIISLLISS